MRLAPGPAAGALDRADAVADRSVRQRDERGQLPRAAMPGDDRAEIWRIDPRLHGGTGAGQRDRSGLAVSGVEVDVRADQREAVAPRRQSRHQLREPDAWRLRRDGRERPAILGRRLRLGIKEVEVARPASQPDQEDRSRPPCPVAAAMPANSAPGRRVPPRRTGGKTDASAPGMSASRTGRSRSSRVLQFVRMGAEYRDATLGSNSVGRGYFRRRLDTA